MSSVLPPRGETDSIESAIREFGFGSPALTRADIESIRLQQAHWTVQRLTARVDFLRDNLRELEEERAKYGALLGPSIRDIGNAQTELNRAVRELTDAKLALAAVEVAA